MICNYTIEFWYRDGYVDNVFRFNSLEDARRYVNRWIKYAVMSTEHSGFDRAIIKNNKLLPHRNAVVFFDNTGKEI